MGRFDAALYEASETARLDPLNPAAVSCPWWPLMHAGRYDEAIIYLKKALAMNPRPAFFHDALSWCCSFSGRHQEAMAEAREGQALASSKQEEVALMTLACAYARAGQAREASRYLEELKGLSSRQWLDPHQVAHVYAAMGKREKTFMWLKKSIEERSGNTCFLKTDAFFHSVMDDPRYKKILAWVGLE